MASPPPSPSPKRKRINRERASTPLQIDTNERHDSALSIGADSPRSKVAATLQDLTLQPPESPQVVIRGRERAETPRKRMKQSQPLLQVTSGCNLNTDPDADLDSLPLPSSQALLYTGTLVIGETPDCKVRIPSSPSYSPTQPGVRSSWDTWANTGSEDGRRKELPLAQPSSPRISASPRGDDSIDRALSPLAQTDDLNLDQIALTWQDNEITGQDIDLTSPDDDGLGINGIGFKPTPAMTYMRSQKRKQQVNEWRAREAREARQKRIERRRGASLGGSRRKSTAKKSVRFEDVG